MGGGGHLGDAVGAGGKRGQGVGDAVARAAPRPGPAAGRLRELMAKYAEVELLVKIGEYKRGGDETTDEAIDKQEEIRSFLRQRTDEKSTLEETLDRLRAIVGR